MNVTTTLLRKRRYQRSAMITLMLILASVIFMSWRWWITQPPLDVPLALDTEQHIDQLIEIRAPDYRHLVVRFERDGWQDPSVPGNGHDAQQWPPVLLHWRLLTRDGSLVSEGSGSTGQVASYNGEYVSHSLGSLGYPQPSGTWRLQVQVVSPQAVYGKVKAHLELDAYSKTATDWRFELLFWGAIVNDLLLWPLIGLGCLVTLGLAVHWRRSQNTGI